MSDLISRQALCEYALNQKDKSVTPNDIMRFPSAKPYTEAEIQKIQDLEQAEMLKAYECGRASAQPESCEFYDTESHFCALHRPSAKPYTEAEIQKMQDLEQAELDKAFEVGKEEGRKEAQPDIIRCKDCKHWKHDHTCREHSLVSPMMANEFCSRAERREDG